MDTDDLMQNVTAVDGNKGVYNGSEASAITPLISVIVPIYNVEKYVRKCLESLRNQTMKQIEVICIDDGSTDASGKIADEYESEEWPIFRVIHTDNRGVSAARNRGIDEAKAEWLMFVDSDDWVNQVFCEIPWRTAVETKADLVAFQAQTIRRGRPVKRKRRNISVGVLDEMKAYDHIGIVAWNKLYSKNLFDDIRYPESQVFEDVATTHKLIHKAERIISLSDCLYYYVMRADSIIHTHTISNRKDRLAAHLERAKILISYGYPNEKAIPYGAAISLLSVMAPCDDPLYKKAAEIVDSINRYPKDLTWKQTFGLMFFRMNKRLFYFISKGLR